MNMSSKITKKVSTFIMAFCMTASGFSYMPAKSLHSVGIHKVVLDDVTEASGDWLVCKTDEKTSGKFKFEGMPSKGEINESKNTFSDVPSGDYKLTVVPENGYIFSGVYINDEFHSSKEFGSLADKIYNYNLKIKSDSTKDVQIRPEFKLNVASGSKNKIFVGDNLCIDESEEKPLTSHSTDSFNLIPGEKQNSYILTINPGCTLNQVSCEGDIELFIRVSGSSTIAQSDGYSIKGVKNLSIQGISDSSGVLNLDGGIQFKNSLNINQNVKIGTTSNPSAKGICGSEGANQNVTVEHANLEINTSSDGSAFENIKGSIVCGSKGIISTVSDKKTFNGCGKVIVRDGGNLKVTSKVSSFDAKAYSCVKNTELQNSMGYLQHPVSWNGSTNENTDHSYTSINSTSPDSQGYYSYELKSLSLPSNRIVYGKNLLGDTESVLNGSVIFNIAGNSPTAQDSKIGEYSFTSDSEVNVTLMPDYGFQLNNSAVKSLSMVPGENKGEYSFVMPDNDIHWSDLFVKSDDKIVINSKDVKGAQISIPNDLICGTAEFVVTSKEAPEDISAFENKSNGLNIMGYFDISLNERILKNGDESQGYWVNNITQLPKPMDVTLDLGEKMKGKASYSVLRGHNGVVNKLDGIYDESSNQLKFATDQYSDYAVGTSDDVRTLSAETTFNGEKLKIIVQDPNNALNDNAVVEVTAAEEGSDRYNSLKEQLDDIYAPKNLAFFDVVIYKDETKTEKYTDLASHVNILFQIPKGWTKENLEAVLVTKEEDTQFDEEVVTQDGVDYVSFWTDHFSPYAMMEDIDCDKIINQAQDQNQDSTDNQDDDVVLNNNDDDDQTNLADNITDFITGDKYRTVIIVASLAVIVSLVTLIFLKKKKK